MISAKKRIVLAITLAEQGGVTSFVYNFAKWLKQADYEVTILAGEGQWLFDRCAEAQIPLIRVPSLKRAISPYYDLKAFFELRRLFKTLKPDAIHLNSTKMGALGSLAIRFAYFDPGRLLRDACCVMRIPRVAYRIGGWIFLEPLPAWQKTLYRWIEKFTARFKDVIICVHPGDKLLAEQVGIKPRQGIVSIPNGIDFSAFSQNLLARDQARQTLGLDPGATVFGTIANFYPAKDLPHYLEACALVAKEKPEAYFVIIGDGSERLQIERRRTELGLTDRVILAGSIDNAPRLLNAFNAFVLPSVKEGMSWSLLEAMAAGLPCVATDVGANKWMLGEAGWIVPAHDPAALSKAMLSAVKNPGEAQIRGLRLAERVQRDFPLEKTYRSNAAALSFTSSTPYISSW